MKFDSNHGGCIQSTYFIYRHRLEPGGGVIQHTSVRLNIEGLLGPDPTNYEGLNKLADSNFDTRSDFRMPETQERTMIWHLRKPDSSISNFSEPIRLRLLRMRGRAPIEIGICGVDMTSKGRFTLTKEKSREKKAGLRQLSNFSR